MPEALSRPVQLPLVEKCLESCRDGFLGPNALQAAQSVALEDLLSLVGFTISKNQEIAYLESQLRNSGCGVERRSLSPVDLLQIILRRPARPNI